MTPTNRNNAKAFNESFKENTNKNANPNQHQHRDTAVEERRYVIFAKPDPTSKSAKELLRRLEKELGGAKAPQHRATTTTTTTTKSAKELLHRLEKELGGEDKAQKRNLDDDDETQHKSESSVEDNHYSDDDDEDSVTEQFESEHGTTKHHTTSESNKDDDVRDDKDSTAEQQFESEDRGGDASLPSSIQGRHSVSPRTNKGNHYSVLKLKQDATPSAIKRAYRRLAIKYHPDKNKADGANENMERINLAYEILRDEEKRLEYLAQLPPPSSPS